MAVIKFDKDKADSLIRDLNRISSDIERCLRKVNNTVANREVSLYDERLKVYDIKDVEVTTILEDGTEQVEIVQEEYLKYDYIANARAYNRAVRLLSAKSTSAKSNATLAIQSVVGALTKVKELISEYENDQQLRITNHLGEVGQFDFNLTDVDFRFILKSYTGKYEILECYFARYDYLPKEFIDFILEKYIKN